MNGYELWHFPGVRGRPAELHRETRAPLSPVERAALRSASRAAHAHLRACGSTDRPEGWALRHGTSHEILAPIPLHLLRPAMDSIPLIRRLPAEISAALLRSTSLDHAAELLLPYGASIEDEGAGSPPVPTGNVRLRLASGEETLLRTMPIFGALR